MNNAATKNPADYKHIAVWGRILGSFEYYIVGQQAKAHAAGAPITAVYEKYDTNGRGPTGEWVTADECSEEMQERIAATIAYLEQN